MQTIESNLVRRKSDAYSVTGKKIMSLKYFCWWVVNMVDHTFRDCMNKTDRIEMKLYLEITVHISHKYTRTTSKKICPNKRSILRKPQYIKEKPTITQFCTSIEHGTFLRSPVRSHHALLVMIGSFVWINYVDFLLSNTN